MQRPPDRKAPPILFSGGGSDWIRRVAQKHKRLIDLSLSPEQKEKLEQWTEAEFVYSTLRLEGVDVSREQAMRVASKTLDASAVGDNERAAMSLLVSLRAAAAVARANGEAAELTAEVLINLHSAPDTGFRRGAGDAARGVKPASPEHLPALIESACRWCSAESFAELNPVEQAAIVLLRLIDLQPFEESNERTALVAASLFTMRGALPPIVIRTAQHAAYRAALDDGARTNTQPMVELIADAIEQSLNEQLEQTGNQR